MNAPGLWRELIAKNPNKIKNTEKGKERRDNTQPTPQGFGIKGGGREGKEAATTADRDRC